MELVSDGNGSWRDPGTGLEVANYLAQQRPVCPVIIHSTNTRAAIAMERALADAGWSVTRVPPYGDLDWVREAWLPAARRNILNQAQPVGATVAVS
jgi:hypothetical protein